jgi:hypothetical protein
LILISQTDCRFGFAERLAASPTFAADGQKRSFTLSAAGQPVKGSQVFSVLRT